MNTVIDEFIEEARSVSVTEAAELLSIKVTRANYAGPCPAPTCGGTDRFSISPGKQAFNCRQCGGKGRDGISLMALAHEHQLTTRTGLLLACADALGRDVPDEGQTESPDERQARIIRIEDRNRKAEDDALEATKSQDAHRLREVDRARGIYLKADEGSFPVLSEYLRRRTGFEMPDGVFANIRFRPNQTYWHGKDHRGSDIAVYAGPAMIAPFVNLEMRITGCHQTWIDLRNGPKFRAEPGFDDKGNPLPAKKMRGTKRGSFIPLFGLLTSLRWVGGEGIENVLAVAGAEGFRADTFYFAAGDLGNLAGPADPASSFRHPTLKKADVNGRMRTVLIQGPIPKAEQGPEEAMQIAGHVTSLVLLADGDSELVFTASAMARAETRLAHEERAITTIWPPDGQDFAGIMTGDDA